MVQLTPCNLACRSKQTGEHTCGRGRELRGRWLVQAGRSEGRECHPVQALLSPPSTGPDGPQSASPMAKGRLLSAANDSWWMALERKTSLTRDPSMGRKKGFLKMMAAKDSWRGRAMTELMPPAMAARVYRPVCCPAGAPAPAASALPAPTAGRLA